MEKVIVSHSGKQHAYHVARAFNELGMLSKFYTSSYIANPLLQNYLTRTDNQFWGRRFLTGLKGAKVESNWRFELKEQVYSRVFGQGKKTLEAVFERDVRFDKYLATRMPKLPGKLFWGFQGSCLHSLEAARRSGKIAICEMAAAHAPAAVRILGEEQKLHPEWADSIDFIGFPPAYYDRLCREPHEADYVIGASEFTLRTLREENVAEHKLRYLPLGFELSRIPFSEKTHQPNQPLRLLYAGRVTQRKGVKYLLEAMKSFSPSDVQLDIIGNVHGSGNALKHYRNYNLQPALSQYDLFRKYNEYDAFVLPSVFEGFGLVIVEAMAAGLPVITTPHTIGPELITHGKNGFIVPIRDIGSVKDSIELLLAKSSDELLLMRQAARQAAVSFSWDSYRMRLKELLHELVAV